MLIRKMLRKLIGTEELLDEYKQLFSKKEDVESLSDMVSDNELATSAALNDLNSRIGIMNEKLKKI